MDPMEYIVPNRKRLPYGMMNFAVIRREDYYYVDKTRFIPMIEQADRFFFFIRPRRFGKSLTLNVLQHYYDVRTRDKFNDLFGDLYIGKHPTANRNSYLVLYLNFSGITGELNDYRKGLDAHCQIRFDFFCEVYSDLLPQGIRERLDEKDGAVNQLDYLVSECERAGQKMYLFIDEYESQGFQSFFFFSASAKNSGFRQFSRGLSVGLFESRFCSHELAHLSLIVSFLRSWFLSMAN